MRLPYFKPIWQIDNSAKVQPTPLYLGGQSFDHRGLRTGVRPLATSRPALRRIPIV
jgi:hypothetical protein